MKRLLALSIGAAAITTMLAPTGPALAGNSFSYIAQGTQCRGSGTEEQPRVTATTSWRMLNSGITPFSSNSFKLKARLVPKGSKFTIANLGYPWGAWVHGSAVANANGKAGVFLTATTTTRSNDIPWDVQVKMVWTRSIKDYVKVIQFPFRSCDPPATTCRTCTAIGTG